MGVIRRDAGTNAQTSQRTRARHRGPRQDHPGAGTAPMATERETFSFTFVPPVPGSESETKVMIFTNAFCHDGLQHAALRA